MVTITESGATVFRVFEPGVQRVEIRGSFTDWHSRPIEMRSCGGGWWEAELTIEPGDHEFQYLVDGNRWTTDYAASGVRLTRMGTWVSLLYVPATEIEPVVTVRQRRRIAA